MAAPRRRWTQEEHDLLLEEVRLHANKYDCMAQIIKRHGKDGEVSNILKDQNNVSLKDKARNLSESDLPSELFPPEKSTHDCAAAMEWSRHGYPPGKEWCQEAFARFGTLSPPMSRAPHAESFHDPSGQKEVIGSVEDVVRCTGSL